MALVSLLSLLFVFSLAFSFIPSSHALPFILLHGTNSSCSDPEVAETVEKLTNFSGVEGRCIEIGNGVSDSLFKPIHKQVELACQKVKETDMLREGYNIVGLSQGNIIARGVIELCDGGPPVKNYVSLAGPHAGVASIPGCGCSDACIMLLAELMKSFAYSVVVQDYPSINVHSSHFHITDKHSSNLQKSLAPSNYLKIPTAIPDYLKNCTFLPGLNNEYPDRKNSTYKERLSSLDNLVLIMFENETVLIPKETSWFGYYQDGSFDTVLSPKQTELYIEDWIGLRSLDEEGKVKFISVEGEHLQISDTDMKTYVVPYLKGNAGNSNLFASVI